MSSDRPLVCFLRFLGGVDMLALVAVVMPWSWMELSHQLTGLGTLPDAPIVGYLTRSASALYTLHGVLVVFLSFDVERYRPLITLLAGLSILHGLVMLAIDLAQGMPAWWTGLEGTTFAATGVIVLCLQSAGGRESGAGN